MDINDIKGPIKKRAFFPLCYYIPMLSLCCVLYSGDKTSISVCVLHLRDPGMEGNQPLLQQDQLYSY